MRHLTVVKALLLALPLMSCLPAIAQEGRVIEAGTGKPVSGVFVVAEWLGQAPNPVDAATTCLRAEVTTSDEEGRFKISSWSGSINPLITDRRRSLGVYKPGYQLAKESRREELFFVIEPSAVTRAERFARSSGSFFHSGCGLSENDMLPLRKAQIAELTALADSKQEHERLSNLLFMVEKTELGEAEAMKRHSQRKRARESAPEAK